MNQQIGKKRASAVVRLTSVVVCAAAFALILALATAETFWAWGSIALSLCAGVLLGWAFWQRHNQRNKSQSVYALPTVVEQEEKAALPLALATDNADSKDQHAPELSAEPGIELGQPIDLLIITTLADQVLVVDEHPRYHLPACTWLTTRPTIALPASHARALGFTPCALCSPDATLLARYAAVTA